MQKNNRIRNRHLGPYIQIIVDYIIKLNAIDLSYCTKVLFCSTLKASKHIRNRNKALGIRTKVNLKNMNLVHRTNCTVSLRL